MGRLSKTSKRTEIECLEINTNLHIKTVHMKWGISNKWEKNWVWSVMSDEMIKSLGKWEGIVPSNFKMDYDFYYFLKTMVILGKKSSFVKAYIVFSLFFHVY